MVFQPAPGARVVLEEVGITTKYVELRDLTITEDWQTKPGADDVVLRNIDAGAFFILSASRVRVLGGSVGPGVDFHPIIAAADQSSTPPRDILFDGVLFHDWTRSNDSAHTECVQIGAGLRLTIRNSTFRNCDIFALFVSQFGDAGPPRYVTIENNCLDEGGDGGYFSVRFSDHATSWRDVLVRNNSALQGIDVDPKPPKSNFRIVGNVAPLQPGGCADDVVYAYNVWDGAACSATDRNAPSGFADPQRLDLHLLPGAAAIDHGSPAAAPATDIDGQTRPAGSRPDAGADESAFVRR